MREEIRRYVIITVATLVAGVIVACGGNGASNNDQGVSVSFLGVYQTYPSSATPSSTPTSGGNNSQQSGCTNLPNLASSPSTSPIGPTNGIHAVAGIQNNLYGQFFRTNQLTLDFFIAGATVQPPSYSAGISILAGPAESAFSNNGSGTGAGDGSDTNNGNGGLRQPQNTSLPPSWNAICNTAFGRIPILPAETAAWLVNNISLIPDPPFTIDVNARFVGTSSAGDVIETNPVYVPVEIVPYVPTAAAAEEGAPSEVGGGDSVDPSDGSGSALSSGDTEQKDAPIADFITED